MTNETPNTKPRRRWYQFSLRTLLIVVTLSAVPLGWVGWKLEQGRRQRPTIAWVGKMGGSVQFGRGWVDSWFGLVSHVDLRESLVSDLSPLAELKNLAALIINDTPVSDLTPLAEVKNLTELWLNDTQVSDLTPLTKLKNLYGLHLHNTQVSEEQVQELQQALPNCQIFHSIRDEE